MKSFFKKIVKFAKRKKILGQFKVYLKNGQYLGDLRAKVFYRKEDEHNEKFCVEHLKRHFPTGFFKRSFFQYNLKTKDKFFDGDIIVFGNTAIEDKPASVKIFNMEKKEIVTIYRDEKKLWSDLNAYEYFAGKLPIVPIILKDLEHRIVKEKMIIGRTVAQLDEKEYYQLFVTIVSYYVEYFKKEQRLKTILLSDLFNEAIEKQIDATIREQIILRFSNIKDKPVPIKTLHGDFTYSNLLLDKQGCYFIDFEHFGDYCFYYDIFWLMQNEYVYGQNKTLMQLYFKGGMDIIFKMLFEAVGECFDENMRDVYYYVFILEMYNKRVFNLEDKNIVFNYIKKILREFCIGV